MIVFAITEQGCSEMEAEIASGEHPVWLANGVLSEPAIGELRSSGVEITVFDSELVFDSKNAIEEALHTIEEHHPGVKIHVAK